MRARAKYTFLVMGTIVDELERNVSVTVCRAKLLAFRHYAGLLPIT